MVFQVLDIPRYTVVQCHVAAQVFMTDRNLFFHRQGRTDLQSEGSKIRFSFYEIVLQHMKVSCKTCLVT